MGTTIPRHKKMYIKPHIKILIVKHRHLHQCTFEMFLKIITLCMTFFRLGQKNVTYLNFKSNVTVTGNA